MQTRIEELCNRPAGGIIGARDLDKEPITPQEILDCLLLSAALYKEHTDRMLLAVMEMEAIVPELARQYRQHIDALESLPELTDHANAEDRLRDMTAARKGLRLIAVLHPVQANILNIAADLLGSWRAWPRPAAKKEGETAPKNRVAALCKRPILAGRDLSKLPITPQEILDCMELTAAFAGEHTAQIIQGMEALAACEYDYVNSHCVEDLLDLRGLPEDLKADPEMLTDYADTEDRVREITEACQALRFTAVLHPAQAEFLNAAADIVEEWWTPFGLEE